MRPPTARTLPDLLREQADRHPDRLALVTREARLTYADLARRVGRLAAWLGEAGVASDDRIGLLSNNRAEWVEVCFAAAHRGVPLAAFNTWVKPRELDYLIGHASPTVLVLVDRFQRQDLLGELRELVPELSADGPLRSARYPDLRRVVVLGGREDLPPGAVAYPDLDSGSSPGDEPAAKPDEVALLLYTSGSTARPKAVALVHSGLIENGFGIGERMGLGPDDRVWLGSPLFWSFGSANALMATFTHGATAVVQSHFEAGPAIDLIERERCTAAYLLPTMTRQLLAEPGPLPERLASLRTGVTIGTPQEVRMAAEGLGISEICNVYGSTETYGNCTVTPHDAPLAARLVSQGPPLPGVRIRVVDPVTHAQLPNGQTGALEVTGYIAAGYHRATPEDDAAFTDDSYYRTGDLGYLDDDGWLRFAARAAEMIKTAGINVSPAEVEEFLLGNPDVAEAAVLGVPDEERGQQVLAFVVPADGKTLAEPALRDYCLTDLASYKVPARFVIVEALPRTDTGKLSRAGLRSMATAAGQAQ